MSEVLIRADANAAMGTGHVMRCLALAHAVRDAGLDVIFAAAELPDGLAERIGDAGFPLLAIAGEPGSAEDFRAMATRITALNTKVVALDGYQFSGSYRADLKALGLPVIAFDDYAACPLHADAVINPSPAARDLPYGDIASGAELLLGPEYAALQPEIFAARSKLPAERERLLVTFGGSDPLAMTLPVAEALVRALPGIPMDVVVGGAVAQAQKIADEAAALGGDITVHRDLPSLAPVMAAAGLAVTAAGSTTWELACLGVPAVLMVVACNQIPNAEGAVRDGWAVMIDGRAEDAAQRIAELAASLWQNQPRRRKMADKAAALVDGKGAARVAEVIRRLARAA